jgi:hypothetical protein
MEALPGVLVMVVFTPVSDCCASAVAADAVAISTPANIDFVFIGHSSRCPWFAPNNFLALHLTIRA